MVRMRYHPDMTKISKTELRHLAELARIKLMPEEEDTLLRDLDGILAHFEELRSLDTSSVAPMTGGTDLRNVFRKDDERENTDRGGGGDAFPEIDRGFLKVPPIFE